MTDSMPTLGVDFGTSTTLIAEGGPGMSPALVPMGETTVWMPSVAVDRNGSFVVGEDALRRSPGSLVRSVKRCITQSTETASSSDGTQSFRADDVIVAVLRELAGRAKFQGLDVSNSGAVRLGCPAMWDADQRGRLLGLATEAGFGVGPSTLVDEPVAAALMWINEEARQGRHLDAERLLVFDMGGGTLDVAVLDVSAGPGRDPEIYVLASEGIDEAGDSFDDSVADGLVEMLLHKGISLDDAPEPALASAYLARAATAAKVALSYDMTTMVDIGYDGMPLPQLIYTREQLDDALQPHLKTAWSLVESTLRAAYLTREGSARPSVLRGVPTYELVARVDHVLLAGGMSQVPGVAAFLERMFPTSKIHLPLAVAPQEAIAAGLAETSSYERVNLQRPPFDFVIEWAAPDGTLREVVVYRAHTRFYQPWEALSKERLYYSWPDGATAFEPSSHRSLPSSGSGVLRVRALDGTPIALRHGGDEAEGLRIGFGGSGFRFVLSPDGSIRVTDGRGEEQMLRADRWPVLRSGLGRIALSLTHAEWTPVDRRSWDTK